MAESNEFDPDDWDKHLAQEHLATDNGGVNAVVNFPKALADEETTFEDRQTVLVEPSKHAQDPDEGFHRNLFDCRNCGQPGHFSRECQEPRKLTMPCFGCGETGHLRAECPNAKPDACNNCGEAGHKQGDCEAPRKLNYDAVPDVTPEAAWNDIDEASDEKDISMFKIAFNSLCKAMPQLTVLDIETKLREKQANIYIIAREVEMPLTSTNVDLQGKADCKYQVSFQYSTKPRRANVKVGWPVDAAENLERLKDAGFPMPALKSFCRNCNQLGHTSKLCPQEKNEATSKGTGIECSNCGGTGHRMRDCTKERVDKFACKNCGEPGHRAADCEKPRNEANIECHRCEKVGHSSKNCPDAPSRGCHNCGKEGHMARDCEEPKNPANTQCRNCDEYGHQARECPKPRDYSRVKCNNCGQMGHTQVRCKEPAQEEPSNDVIMGVGNENSGESAPAFQEPTASGDWDNSNAGGLTGNGEATSGANEMW